MASVRTVTLAPADRADRNDAAAFAGRVARWDPMGPVRLRTEKPVRMAGQAHRSAGALSTAEPEPAIRMWATTPFDTLASRSINGRLTPVDATVHAGNLVAALAVSTGDELDPGPVVDSLWRSQLPPADGWVPVDEVPAEVLARLSSQGVSAARDRPGPHGAAPTALLDAEALSVSGAGMRVSVPMRTLFALTGMGFAPDRDGETVRVSATDAWLRLDARFGAVVRRRHSLLALFV